MHISGLQVSHSKTLYLSDGEADNVQWYLNLHRAWYAMGSEVLIRNLGTPNDLGPPGSNAHGAPNLDHVRLYSSFPRIKNWKNCPKNEK